MLDRLRIALERRLAKLMGEVGAAPSQEPVEIGSGVAADLRKQGNQQLAVGALSQAEELFRQALRFDGKDIDTHICLGYSLKEQGRNTEARVYLQTAIRLSKGTSRSFDAQYLLAQIAEESGDLEEAIDFLNAVLRLQPDFVRACVDAHRLLARLGRFGEIEALYQRCIAASPEQLDFFYGYGNWLLERSEYSAAMTQFDAILERSAGFAEAHNDRGACLVALNRHCEAIESCSAAIALKPELGQAYANRGDAHMLSGQYEAAVRDLREALRLLPGTPILYNNLGEALQKAQKPELALPQYRKAIELASDFPLAHWNLALQLLLLGNFRDGFLNYERRFEALPEQYQRKFSSERWTGQQPLNGKSVYLFSEQGMGDMIQFCRYVPLLTAMGARVVLEVPKPLLDLMKGFSGISDVVALHGPQPFCDYHVALMSLPHLLQTELDSIPKQLAYLSDLRYREKWSQKLEPIKGLAVGLVWSGNAKHENDRNRSIPLSLMLQGLPTSCTYVSLQKEVQPSDLEALAANSSILHFGEELTDFRDTAALCEIVDVVVSVDTSVAHLAASIGRPTWVLLPRVPDWRWLLERTDSPWYPSAKLYRQEVAGDWAGVLSRVCEDLTGLA